MPWHVSNTRPKKEEKAERLQEVGVLVLVPEEAIDSLQIVAKVSTSELSRMLSLIV